MYFTLKKRILNSILILCFVVASNAQEKPRKYPSYIDMMTDMSVNFYTVCDSAEAYFKTIDKDKKGSGYKPYQRWKYLNESRYAPSGSRIVDDALPYKEYLRIKKETKIDDQRSNLSTSGWQSLGPDEITNITGHYAAGLGRVEFVEVNKNNDQEIYIGSRSGGLWRTSNGGGTWSHNTDFLPASGVNAIAANPTNFNEVLINCKMAVNDTSFGIYKSNDGGQTFTATNFIPVNLNLGGLGSTFKVFTIQYHPIIPNLVFVGTSQGIYRSTDNLQTWTKQISGGDVLDIDFHPIDSNIIYIYDHYFATNKNRILKSSDRGLTYTAMSILPDNNNAKLKISIASSCTNCVFVSSDNGIYKSTDAGATFSTIQNPPPTGVSLWGAMPNDTDITKFVSGYVDLYRSSDSAASFNQCTWWYLANENNGLGSLQQNYNSSTNYVHADTNYLDCVNGVFYSCSDGFLSKSVDNGLTWQKLSLTVGIRENYCLGTSQSNNSVTVCGSQDNGTSIKNESGWIEAYGADGMEGIIMPLNPDYIIGSTQNAGRIRFLDGGITSTGIAPPGQTASWVAPMFYDPNNQMTLYSFGSVVHKSTNFGTNWVNLGSPITFTGAIEEAAIAENNSNKIIIAKENHIELSIDGGITFASILSNLPSNLYISDVTFDPDNDETIVVTYSDVSSAYGANKVFISTNSGANWTNITYNLGFMPVHCSVIANGIIYVGAEIGVYYKPISGNTWNLFSNNLPNVSVRELEVNYGANTIKAATWGRGLWEEKLVGRENFPAIVKTEITNPPTFYTPKTTIPQFVTSQIEYSGTLSNVFVSWAIETPAFNITNVIPMVLVSGNTWKSLTALPDFPEGTKVFFKVTATGSNSDTSQTYKFMYELKPSQVCAASGENANGSLWINNFTCSNITNVSNSFNAYTYYSSIPIVMFKNSSYTATGNFSTSWGSNDFIVWIDYNNDSYFQLSERVVFDSDTGASGTGSFAIPTDAFEGNVKMRVRLGYWGDYTEACDTTLGEVEDYLVTIGTKPIITFSGNTNYCVNDTVTLTYTGSAVDSFNWELTNGINSYSFSGNVISTDTLPIGDYTVKINFTKYGVTFQEVFENYFKISPTPTSVVIANLDESICPNVIKTLSVSGGLITGSKSSKISGNINYAIPDNTLTSGISKTLAISSIPANSTITKVEVLLNITHPLNKDLRINLEAPNGKIVNLFNQHGDNGDNLTNTIITSDGTAPAMGNTASAAPFTGTFRATLANQTSIGTTPAVNSTVFSDLFTVPNGDWKVRVYDDGSSDLGTLLNCNIVITYNSQSLITWSPLTDLYTSASCVSGSEYTGNNVSTVYTKPNSTITYTANANPQSCLVSDNVTYTINTIPNKFTAGNWSNGIPPTTGGTQILEFDDPTGFTSSNDLSGCSCKVSSGNVVISSGTNLILERELNVTGGTITFNNNANLIQVQDVVNAGNIVSKRNSNPLKRLDYTIWSSPVSGVQTLKQFSPLTLDNRFYNYNTSTNFYSIISNPIAQTFNKANGYLVRMPDNHPTTPTIWEGSFSGNPNNGQIEIDLTYVSDGFSYNMIGNPYPSTIDAEAFLNANSSTINGTLYFWRKTNNASGTAYATYTLGGATTTSPTSPTPNGIIQVGQGFFVEAKNVINPKALFTNSIRILNNNNQFFRGSSITEKHRFWLNLTNSNGLFSQMLVGYMTGATNEIDNGIDGKTLKDSPVSLTSLLNNEEYTIQGKALPFDIVDSVPLNFKTDVSGNFTISIGNYDGVFENGQAIFLKDNQFQSTHNLNESEYNFYSEIGNFSNRFEIVYQNSILSIDDFADSTISIYPNPIEKSSYLYFNGIQNETLFTLYDVTGKLLQSKKIEENKVLLDTVAAGVYFVKIKSESKTTIKKLIIK